MAIRPEIGLVLEKNRNLNVIKEEIIIEEVSLKVVLPNGTEILLVGPARHPVLKSVNIDDMIRWTGVACMHVNTSVDGKESDTPVTVGVVVPTSKLEHIQKSLADRIKAKMRKTEQIGGDSVHHSPIINDHRFSFPPRDPMSESPKKRPKRKRREVREPPKTHQIRKIVQLAIEEDTQSQAELDWATAHAMEEAHKAEELTYILQELQSYRLDLLHDIVSSAKKKKKRVKAPSLITREQLSSSSQITASDKVKEYLGI